MSESKSDRDKEWKSIDIFLFTNGEQSSPPRKHHIDIDSLMVWNGTLQNLARSHFGPDTIVDLYTTDGNKIDDPSQLTHQAAYVAVQPPCTFIQAGYENYLIKATRSWEKTLLRISNSKESTNKGNINFDLTHSQNHDDSGGANDQNSKKELTTKTPLKNERSTVRPCIVNVKPPQNRNKAIKCTESNKQMQKKKTPCSPHSPSHRQAGTLFKITPASKRVLIKTRENFSRKPLEVKKVISTTTDEKLLLRSSRVNHCNKKVIPSTTITNFNVMEKKLKGTQSKESQNLNHQTANNDVVDKNILNEKKLVISSIYKNLENETKSVTAIKCDTTLNRGDSNNAENSVAICNEELRDNAVIKLPDNTENNNNEIKFDVTTDFSLKKSNNDACHECCETRRQLDHFVSILNNDKVLRLQLNLEINNCNVSVTTEQINNTNEAQPQRTAVQEEKETQVNIFELSNSICLQNTQHGTIDNYKEADELLKKVIKDEHKVIILNCSCGDCMGFHYLLQSNVQCDLICNEQNLSGLTSNVVDDTERCDCEINSINKYQNVVDTRELVTTNLDGDVEKTILITSVHKLSLHNAEPATSNKVNDNENLQREKTERFIHSDVSAKEKFYNIIDTNTQTNWCNVMLEARYNADGRYTFHLPSLQKIKMIPQLMFENKI